MLKKSLAMFVDIYDIVYIDDLKVIDFLHFIGLSGAVEV